MQDGRDELAVAEAQVPGLVKLLLDAIRLLLAPLAAMAG